MRKAAWTEAISYSGFYEFEDVDNAAEVRKNMLSAMNSSCPNCPDSIKKDIREFVNFCFQ